MPRIRPLIYLIVIMILSIASEARSARPVFEANKTISPEQGLEHALKSLDKEKKHFLKTFNWERPDRKQVEAEFASHMNSFETRRIGLLISHAREKGQVKLQQKLESWLGKRKANAAAIQHNGSASKGA